MKEQSKDELKKAATKAKDSEIKKAIQKKVEGHDKDVKK